MERITLVQVKEACTELLRRIDAGEITEDNLGLVIEESRTFLNDAKFQEWRNWGGDKIGS